MLDDPLEGVYGAVSLLSGQFDVSGSDPVSVYFRFNMALCSVILQKSDSHSIYVNHSPKKGLINVHISTAAGFAGSCISDGHFIVHGLFLGPANKASF